MRGIFEWVMAFFLCFKRKHYREIDLDGFPAVWVYKNLFGRKYVLGIFEKPPWHPNCRCVI
jgi:hypothetical protein